MKEIEKHLGHPSQLETHVHGKEGGISKITVDCTRCGVEVATIFDAQEGCNEENPVYLRAILSAGCASSATYALVQLHEDLVEELLCIRDQLMDMQEQGEKVRVHSFNLARIGEMQMDQEVIVLKNYDAQHSTDQWDLLHSVIGVEPPDDFMLEASADVWEDLIDLPVLDAKEIRCIATQSGVYWEFDAPVPHRDPEKPAGEVEIYCSYCIPWRVLEQFMKEAQHAEDHQ